MRQEPVECEGLAGPPLRDMSDHGSLSASQEARAEAQRELERSDSVRSRKGELRPNPAPSRRLKDCVLSVAQMMTSP